MWGWIKVRVGFFEELGFGIVLDLMAASQAELRSVIRLRIIKLYVIMQAKYFSDWEVGFVCEEDMIPFSLVAIGVGEWNGKGVK